MIILYRLKCRSNKHIYCFVSVYEGGGNTQQIMEGHAMACQGMPCHAMACQGMPAEAINSKMHYVW